MSLGGTLRAFPTLLRIGFAEALAYRAEMIVWMLATTMPLVMLALWTAVAHEAPVGRWGEAQFIAYFLATFIVRQIASSWVFYSMNFEVRNGTLAMRLLRPIHPLVAYGAESVAALPIRWLVALPAAIVVLAVLGADGVTSDPVLWLLWVLAVTGAYALSLGVNFCIGCSAFFMESSMKVMDLWLVFYFVLSGYLIPVALFPPALAGAADWLPFRYQLGLPVEIMTGALDRASALALCARQWAWVVVAFGLTAILWRRGVRRFAAYGG